ncbi:MAG: diacylglycerol kinase (ATP) [Candidatus Azotimanducaceae bacterium]|jgi:diacylglycerol kinase (ATP)
MKNKPEKPEAFDFNKEANTGLRHLINAFSFSLKGLKAAFIHESAFRQELALGLFLIPAAFWVGDNATEKAILLLTLFLVLIVELLNSAVEAAIDRFGGDYHELSGRAKDLGSAAVMISLITVVLVWSLVIYENWTQIVDDIIAIFS